MDEMKIKVSTRLMRGLVSRIIAKVIYKKTGCKVKIHLNDLDVNVIDGETSIGANIEAKLENDEFIKLMKLIGKYDEES